MKIFFMATVILGTAYFLQFLPKKIYIQKKKLGLGKYLLKICLDYSNFIYYFVNTLTINYSLRANSHS